MGTIWEYGQIFESHQTKPLANVGAIAIGREVYRRSDQQRGGKSSGIGSSGERYVLISNRGIWLGRE